MLSASLSMLWCFQQAGATLNWRRFSYESCFYQFYQQQTVVPQPLLCQLACCLPWHGKGMAEHREILLCCFSGPMSASDKAPLAV